LVDPSTVSVEIPEGFETVAFFSRLCRSGMVSWADVERLSMRKCYELALMVDWQEMSQHKANLTAARYGK
jgi:hypothetical protein